MNKGRTFKADSGEDARLFARANLSQQNKLAMCLEVAEELRQKKIRMEEKEILEEVERLKKMA